MKNLEGRRREDARLNIQHLRQAEELNSRVAIAPVGKEWTRWVLVPIDCFALRDDYNRAS
jgi:hypothetical protein